ncbi:MAG: outer membrane beta-barrel protein [Bacteroidales bacterium]|nr:outer membrane beta-barrel protein [Bacteroidales bacterium]
MTGRLYDDQVNPLVSGTVVLLNPVDSTMEFFGITNAQGQFEIRNIKEGSYLLQASFMGFHTFYNPVRIPRAEGSDVGDIVMQPLPVDLEGAEVVGEAVPLQIHGDTVVYNAAAFKTRPDAMTEELLKKLPGVEVDRAGNIKALGEDVNIVYVDGKEFFGSDPTVATRNIPADAIDKVKVYDKKSDESEFTGIDDGTRNKTINLELKEDKKKGVFGDVLAGYGTGQHYKASGKVYRFTDKIQMAGLGMINNVNEYGFSFNDYLDFNGGIAAMKGGGGSAKISMGGDNAFPINFGQPVDGLATTGAGGLNFSYSTDKHNRTYISYLINGSDKDLEQLTRTERYTEEGSFTTSDQTVQNTGNMAHRINFGLRRRIDSTHNLIFSGNMGLMYNDLARLQETGNMIGEELVSSLLSDRVEQSDRISGNLSGTYYRMIGKNKSVLKFSADGNFSKSLDQIRIDNQTNYIPGNEPDLFNQYQDNRTDQSSLSLVAAYTQKIGKGLYLDPVVRLGGTLEQLDRVQGPLDNGMVPVDSVSPAFNKDYRWIRPGFNFRWNTKKSQLSVGIMAEFGTLENSLNQVPYPESALRYFTPTFSWDYSAAAGRKFNIYYSSSVNTPTVSQLLPVVNYLNPLNIYYGNPSLAPEYKHNLMVHWLIFDQFSFTSFMMALSGGYTSDKINWSTTVTDDLVQISTLTNVDWDYQSRLNLDFSTPIRKLGIKVNLDVEESWNRGMNLVNDVNNIYNTLNHRYSLSADNRKKKKWDVESGLGMTLTNTWYDIQESLNNRYFDLSWFGDIRYTPSEKWHFEVTADVTSYSDLGVDESIQVPLLRAEASYFFLAHHRGVLTLSGFDLLDRNQNVQRISELNYLRETRSNTMGRYVMLTFKYRLNKMAREGGIKVDMHKRR